MPGSAAPADVTRALTAGPPAGAADIDLADPARRRFGDYELLAKLGEGGMGVVYRARQLGLDRDVAIKLLPIAGQAAAERFRREARHAARMQHPNIVEIHEVGERDGLHWFSMRLIDGESLDDRIQREGPMQAAEAARMLRKVAEAMDYAHRLGVLHLDLKPANVLLTQAGEPLIADFGLARRIDAGEDGSAEISGTPSYMSPEQARPGEHPLGAGTDIYGLGATLYKMLTGRAPFRGGDAHETLDRVVSVPPPRPSEVRPGIPADLEAICLKCLEKSPARRYAGARELADDLARFVEGRPVSARPLGVHQRVARWARREPRVALATAAVFVSLAAGFGATVRQWREAVAARATAEAQREEASAQRAIAQARAVRLQQGMGLMAELYPTTAEELQVLENPRDAAGKAVAWLQAELPGQEQAQSEILAALSDSLVSVGKEDAADNLSYQISVRMGAAHLREVIASLLRRGDAESALAAAAISYNLQPGTPLFADTMRAAVAAAPDDPDTLFVAALLCNDPGTPPPCAVADAHERLVALQPDDAANWVLYADRVDGDPVRIREAIGRGAAATRADDRFRRLAGLFRDAVVRSGVATPAFLAESTRGGTPNVDPAITLGYLRGWDAPLLTVKYVREACDPRTSPRMDAALRRSCLSVGRRLVETRGAVITNMVGTSIVMRLARGTPLWDEMLEVRRGWYWASRNTPTLERLERDTDEVIAPYARDLIEAGELEAFKRRLERHGVPRTPPAGWLPDRPEGLVPEEFREAFLAELKAGGRLE